ncbi:MAG: hypothetical protein V5A44_08795 [Haloarculaceae archaeon]
MSETLSDRLDAVERALTDGETDLTDVRDRAALSAEVDRLDARLDELEAQTEELGAAVEAVRGYAGNVRAVNRDVERRASAALAKAEALETALGAPGEAPTEPDVTQSRTTGRESTDQDRRPDSTESGAIRSQPSVDTSHDSETSRASTPTGTGQPRDSNRHVPTTAPGSTARPSADVDGDRDGEDAGSGTEEFIERVRDAL